MDHFSTVEGKATRDRSNNIAALEIWRTAVTAMSLCKESMQRVFTKDSHMLSIRTTRHRFEQQNEFNLSVSIELSDDSVRMQV